MPWRAHARSTRSQHAGVDEAVGQQSLGESPHGRDHRARPDDRDHPLDVPRRHPRMGRQRQDARRDGAGGRTALLIRRQVPADARDVADRRGVRRAGADSRPRAAAGAAPRDGPSRGSGSGSGDRRGWRRRPGGPARSRRRPPGPIAGDRRDRGASCCRRRRAGAPARPAAAGTPTAGRAGTRARSASRRGPGRDRRASRSTAAAGRSRAASRRRRRPSRRRRRAAASRTIGSMASARSSRWATRMPPPIVVTPLPRPRL